LGPGSKGGLIFIQFQAPSNVSCRNILFISAMQRLSHLFTSRKSERGKEINKLISKLQESS